MAEITLHDQIVHTIGELPAVGRKLPAFTLTKQDLSDFGLEVVAGRKVVLNIFPSLDTGVCAMSVRRFNELAAGLDDTVVLCISADLPFAQARFCGAEGIENVITASSFRSTFGEDYGVTLITGPLRGVCSRAVVVADAEGVVRYTEQVPSIGNEPNYDAAMAALAEIG